MDCSTPGCTSPSPGAYSNSCPLSRWCHPTISSSIVPFSSGLRSFPASESFLISRLFTSGDESIGVSASASVLAMNIQDWFPLGWTGWISLQSKGLSRVFSNTTVQKHQFLVLSFLYCPNLSLVHDYWKNHSFDYMDLCWQSNIFAFWYAARFVIAFVPRSKCFLISWLQSPSVVSLEPRKIVSHCFPIYLQWSDGTRCHDLSFSKVEF